MNIRDAMITAAFMWEGVKEDDALLEHWGQGCYELCYAVAEFAELSGLYLDAVFTVFEKDFPGVYDYDVSEPFGAWLRKHIEALNERPGDLLMPSVPADFAGAIKGKKSLSSMRDAVDTELAHAKIAANEIGDRIQINLQALRERDDLSFLFPDVKQLVLKARDDLTAVIAMRIAEHEQKEAARREAEQRAAEAIERASQPVPAAVPAPAAAPAVIAQPVVAPAPQPELSACTDEPPTLKLGAVCERLGFNVTADFLASLGIAAHVERSAKLYRESDFPRICAAMVAHIQRVAQQPAIAA